MKRLMVFISILLVMVWSGTAIGAVDVNNTNVNNTNVNNKTEAVSTVSDLPEHSVDLPQIQSELFSLKSRVNQLEADLRHAKDAGERREEIGMVLILFGTVCALWAQNTGRNPWIWFFAGAFFNVLTALVMLKRNTEDNLKSL